MSIISSLKMRLHKWRAIRRIPSSGLDPEVRQRMIDSAAELEELKEKLSDKNLRLARQELVQWRQAHQTDYRGRPFPERKCKCGLELQRWPDPNDSNQGIWCENFGDLSMYSSEYDSDYATRVGFRHDIRDDNNSLLKTGKCTAVPHLTT